MKDQYKQAANNYPLPKTLAKETSKNMKRALNMPVEDIHVHNLVSEDKSKKRSGAKIVQVLFGLVAVAAVVIFTFIFQSSGSLILTELNEGSHKQEVSLKSGYLYFEETDETLVSKPPSFGLSSGNKDVSLQDYKEYLGGSVSLPKESLLNLNMDQQIIIVYYDSDGNIKYDELYRVYNDDNESELKLYISKSPPLSYPWATDVSYQSEINNTPLWVEWNSQNESYSAKFEYQGLYYFCTSNLNQEDFILFLIKILK